jgi:ketosteroid isomerase-like protein
MPEDHVRTIEAIYGEWGVGNFPRLDDLYDPHVTFVLRPEFPDAGVYLGAEEIAGYMRGFLEPWVRVTISAEEIIVAGDSVLVAVHQRGAGRGSGLETDFRYFHAWTFRGSSVIRWEAIRNRPEALEVVGLAE